MSTASPGATGRGSPASSRKSSAQTIAMAETAVCNLTVTVRVLSQDTLKYA
jgi:hypothetical protein